MKINKSLILLLVFQARVFCAADTKFMPAQELFAPLTDADIPTEVQNIVKSYLSADLYSAVDQTGKAIEFKSYFSIYSLIQLSRNRIASGSDEGTIRIRDIASGECLQALKGHTNTVYTLIPLPRERIASGSKDETIRIWDIDSGKCLKVLKGHTDCVYSLIQLPGNRIASGSRDNTIRIWYTNSGECLKVLNRYATPIFILDYLSKIVYSLIQLPGNRIAAGSGQAIRIWHLNSGKCLKTLNGHTSVVSNLIQLSDDRIASGSWDKTIRIWDINSGQCLKVFKGHTDWIHSLIQLPGNRLLSGSQDKTIKIWDEHTGECLQTIECESPVKSLSSNNKGEVFVGLSNGSILKFIDLYSALESNQEIETPKILKKENEKARDTGCVIC